MRRMKTFVTKDFKKTTNLLKRKHNKRALNDLYKALEKLSKGLITPVTFNNNHRLENSECYDMHIGGQYSDIILVWKYDNEDDSLVINLKCRDLTNHKELNRKNYNKETKYEEFDIATIKEDSLKGDNKMKKIVSLKKTTIDSIKDNSSFKSRKEHNAYLNAIDCLYYGYGRSYWNNCGLSKEDADRIWEMAHEDCANDEIKDSKHTKDSEEDLGWISTPELLEEDDFKDEGAYKYWVEALTILKNSTTKKQRLELAQQLMGYLSDFSNKYVKEEVRNDLRHVITQHDYFFGDSKHKRFN